MTDETVVDRLIGSLQYLYYSFLDKFHVRPIDMSDFINGLLYMSTVSYIQDREIKKEKQRLERKAASSRKGMI